MEVIPKDWKVPGVFRARLGDKAGRQRAMQADGHLLLVLHELPVPEESGRKACLFWRDAEGEWHSGRAETGVFHLRKHVECYAEAAGKLEDQCENATSADEYFEVLQIATPLLRSARNLYRTLQEAREAVPADRDLIVLRDEAGDIERTVELAHSEAQNGLNFTVARQSEELARSSHQLALAGHRLNLLAAVFLPLMAITSIFGMNLASGLEHRFAPFLFWLTLLAGLAVGGALLAKTKRDGEPPDR